MGSTRRDFLKRSALGLAAAGVGTARPLWAAEDERAIGSQSKAASRPPNIIIVLADDMGYGDAHYLDPEFSKIPTPNIDRLATQGMAFTDAHSPCAVCSPTRYGLLTGRYAWRTRLQRGVLKAWDPPLIAPDRLTLASMLKQQGYHTAIIGKWHLGLEWTKKDDKIDFDQSLLDGPTHHGFDYYFGMNYPNDPPYAFIENNRLTQSPTDFFDRAGKDSERGKKLGLTHSGVMAPGWRFEQILPTITDKAVSYIGDRAAKKEPFFLYFALTTPHPPFAPSAAFKGKSGIDAVGDLIMETDWALGRVMAALDQHGLADNTLLIFTTDNGHGDSHVPFDQAGHRVSGPFRGAKHDVWEGGHRVPFVARWPGVIAPGSRCSRMICLSDLMATCAEIEGVTLPPDAAPDSVSFVPLLKGAPDAGRKTMVVQSGPGQFAIREGKWLLALAADPEAPAGDRPPVQLYDLDADPGQTTNLQGRHPEIVAHMTGLLEKIVADGRSTPGPRQENDVPIELWKTVRPTTRSKDN